MDINEALDRQLNVVNRLGKEEEYAIEDENGTAALQLHYALTDAGGVLNYLLDIKEKNGD